MDLHTKTLLGRKDLRLFVYLVLYFGLHLGLYFSTTWFLDSTSIIFSQFDQPLISVVLSCFVYFGIFVFRIILSAFIGWKWTKNGYKQPPMSYWIVCSLLFYVEALFIDIFLLRSIFILYAILMGGDIGLLILQLAELVGYLGHWGLNSFLILLWFLNIVASVSYPIIFFQIGVGRYERRNVTDSESLQLNHNLRF
ncbi:MAG: hypothetical protein ACFFC7_09610 [Candidatus Hermodarchaeota archaeon]